MKKNLSFRKSLGLICFVLAAHSVNSQIESGLWFVEGSVGDFKRETTKYSEGSSHIDNTFSNVSLYPVIGYMAGNNIAFGLRMKTGFEKTKQSGVDQSLETESVITRNTLSLEPFMRIYFPTAHYRTRPYIQLGVGKGYQSSREEYTTVQSGSLMESEDYSRHDEYLQVDGELGLNYLLTPDVAISSGVGYYLMYGKFDYNLQQSGPHAPQQANSHNGDSSRGSMLWRFGFAFFF